MSAPGQRLVGWSAFAEDVALIAEVPEESVKRSSRVVDDLGLDSVALAELAVVLIDDYEVHELARELEHKDWNGVTVGELFDEYFARPA